MNFHARHDKPLPSWDDFLGASSRALEARLRLEDGFDLPEAMRPERHTQGLPGPGPWRRFARRAWRFLVSFVVLAHLSWILWTSFLIVVYRFVDPSVTVLMAERKWVEGWKVEAPRDLALRQVPVYLRSMLVAVEDGKFYEHHGIDLEAFKRAYEINSRINRPMYGGSTLTMQVARTLFLVPVKSYLRKYAEVIVALELELFLPKERILELYFGYAEWGKGIFGIEAASRRYYGVGIQKLSRDQGARLVALLSSPIRFNPSTLGKSAILRERYAYLARRWVNGSASPGVAGSGQGSPRDEAAPPATPEPGEDADLEAPSASATGAELAPGVAASPGTGALTAPAGTLEGGGQGGPSGAAASGAATAGAANPSSSSASGPPSP